MPGSMSTKADLAWDGCGHMGNEAKLCPQVNFKEESYIYHFKPAHN